MVKSPEFPHIDTSKFGPDAPAAVVFTFNPEVWIPDTYWAYLMGWPGEFVKDNSFAIRYKSRTLLPGNIFKLGEGSVYYPKYTDPIITPHGFRLPPKELTSEELLQEFDKYTKARVLADGIHAEPMYSDSEFQEFCLMVSGKQPGQWSADALFIPSTLELQVR